LGFIKLMFSLSIISKCFLKISILMLVDGYLFSLNLWYMIDIIPKSSIFNFSVAEKSLFWLNKEIISNKMINDFLIISCIGNNDKIGLKINNKFFIHNFQTKIQNNEKLVSTILNLINQHKVNINENFSVLVNSGPGSFSSVRIAISVAKGIRLSKNARLFGYKNSDLPQFNLENIEILFKKKLIEKKLIKPLYLS